MWWMWLLRRKYVALLSAKRRWKKWCQIIRSLKMSKIKWCQAKDACREQRHYPMSTISFQMPPQQNEDVPIFAIKIYISVKPLCLSLCCLCGNEANFHNEQRVYVCDDVAQRHKSSHRKETCDNKRRWMSVPLSSFLLSHISRLIFNVERGWWWLESMRTAKDNFDGTRF